MAALALLLKLDFFIFSLVFSAGRPCIVSIVLLTAPILYKSILSPLLLFEDL